MAQRSGMAPQLVCCWLLVALVLPSAATPPFNPKIDILKITFSRSISRSKRLYVMTCKNKKQPCIVSCPLRCPNECLASCNFCTSFCMCDIFPGTTCGDPRFTGGDGNTFYFHGKKDQDFCIVSDNDLHINAHFIGNHNPAVKRNFTWIQAIGVTFGGGHRLYVGARKAAKWEGDEDHIHITLDGETVKVETFKVL